MVEKYTTLSSSSGIKSCLYTKKVPESYDAGTVNYLGYTYITN